MKKIIIFTLSILAISSFIVITPVKAQTKGGDDGYNIDSTKGGDDGYAIDAVKGGDDGYKPPR